MKTAGIAMALLAAAAIGVSGNGYAQKADFGKSEYDASCAVCHGPLGQGDGPYVSLGYAIVSDLTTLAKGNKGVFPVQRVFEFIDGRQLVRAHTAKDMPVWGSRYAPAIREGYFSGPDCFDPEAVVQIRILALTEYLYRLQAK